MLLQVDPAGTTGNSTGNGGPTGRKMYLFPAWPKGLDVSFKLHAPLQTVLEGELVGGKLKSLVVTPASRRKDVVVVNGSE
jgi:hypothetical protein